MPKPWISRSIRGLFHASWILLVSLVGLEVILAVMDPLGMEFYSEVGEYFLSKIRLTKHGYYLNIPRDKYTMFNTLISINSEGFRDDEFAIKKPGDTVRVLCIGDSMAFGWGAPQNSLFPVMLEKMAREEGFPCEVITAAACSWNTRMEFNFLRHRGRLYEPDILLLLIVGNDLMTPYNTSPRWSSFIRNVVLEKRGLAHSYLVRTFLHFQNKFLAGPDFIKQYERDPTVFDENILAVGEMMTLCRTLDIRPVVFIGVTGDGSSAFDELYSALYTDALKKHGVTAQTCEIYFSERSLKVSPADTHPSELGHLRVAQTMYPELRSILVELTGQGDRVPQKS